MIEEMVSNRGLKTLEQFRVVGLSFGGSYKYALQHADDALREGEVQHAVCNISDFGFTLHCLQTQRRGPLFKKERSLVYAALLEDFQNAGIDVLAHQIVGRDELYSFDSKGKKCIGHSTFVFKLSCDSEARVKKMFACLWPVKTAGL